MKCTTLARRIILAALLILFAVPASSPAQPRGRSIDLARMERDLDIMEGILDKLLAATGEGDFQRIQTRGSYLPGLGAVFQVSVQNLPPIVSIEVNKKSGNIILQTRPESTSGKSKENRLPLKAVLNPVKEFLGLYADAIRELPAEEHVVVIISPRNYGTIESMFFSLRKAKSGPGIALLVRRKDISLYRSGKLSERAFRNRVRIVDLAPDVQNHPELRIFANVLETALGGYEDQTFRIYGRVNYFYLPEFGALYLFDAMFTGNRRYDVLVNQQKYQQSLQEYTKHLEQYRKQIELYRLRLKKWQEAQARGEQIKLKEKPQEPSPIPSKSIWVYSSVSDSAFQENRLVAFQNFEDRLRQYILDYGRTLRILKKNQWLMVSVKMRKHYEGIPKRMVMQIKKSDLELYDQRRLGRESALKRIRTMYYER